MLNTKQNQHYNHWTITAGRQPSETHRVTTKQRRGQHFDPWSDRLDRRNHHENYKKETTWILTRSLTIFCSPAAGAEHTMFGIVVLAGELIVDRPFYIPIIYTTLKERCRRPNNNKSFMNFTLKASKAAGNVVSRAMLFNDLDSELHYVVTESNCYICPR